MRLPGCSRGQGPEGGLRGRKAMRSDSQLCFNPQAGNSAWDSGPRINFKAIKARSRVGEGSRKLGMEGQERTKESVW